MKIQMVDLLSQYEKIKEEVDAGIRETIEQTAFINGPSVKLFQSELANYLKVKKVITCANGTDALQVAMMALDLQAGDEVITSNFTFIATVEVIALLKLKPVLVDVDPDTFNLDPKKIEEAITPKTKAIIPVHLFGQSADMDEILRIAKEYKLYVIEDAAQALGTNYNLAAGKQQKAGTIGTIGTTSFFPSKNLGCFGDGGALMTNNEELGEKIRVIVNHGSKVKYYHEEVGINSRLDTIQAAILRVKLQHLNSYNKARKSAANYYDALLAGYDQIQTPVRSANSSHIFHQYTLRIKTGKRDEIRQKLAEQDIPAMIYYPVPLSLQVAFLSAGYKKGDFPVTELLCEEVLSLPMHTELNNAQQEYIAEHLLKII
ncbi:MAG: DegT/DnrJ/EryC1/StrS family aminotransferase [Bacteroidales bacterium]|nr:DegT/DnrJ/EryC1/StrS family aminotransferase [Bacteroidales bacterium]